MTIEQVTRITKRLMIGLFVFDGLLFGYAMISGRIIGEFYGNEIIIGFAYFALVISALSTVVSLIYALAKKVYPLLWYTFGFLMASFVTFILALILVLASVW